jgi:hypothetical protein
MLSLQLKRRAGQLAVVLAVVLFCGSAQAFSFKDLSHDRKHYDRGAVKAWFETIVRDAVKLSHQHHDDDDEAPDPGDWNEDDKKHERKFSSYRRWQNRKPWQNHKLWKHKHYQGCGHIPVPEPTTGLLLAAGLLLALRRGVDRSR